MNILNTYQRYTSGVNVMQIPTEEVSEAEGALLLLDGETDGFSIDATTYDSITPAAYTGGPVGGTVAVINTGDPTDDLSNVALDSSSLVQSGTSPKMVHFPTSPYVRWTPHNLLIRSDDLGTSWDPTSATISTNTAVSPDGQTTADTLTTTSTSNSYVGQLATVLASITHTASWYVKKGTTDDFVFFQVTDESADTYGSWFNINSPATGTTHTDGAGVLIDRTITSVGNGWYRLTITGRGVSTTSQRVRIFLTSADNTTNCTNGATVLLWGAQFNRGPIATPYLATTSAARIGIPQAYDPVAAQYGILVEPAATNNVLQSENLGTTWAVFASASVATNTTVAPDGSTTADTVTFGAGSTSECYQGVGLAAGAITISVWASTASGTKAFRLKLNDSGLGGQFSSDQTATTTWQRFSFTQTLVNALDQVSLANAVGGGAGDVIFWGAQVETGTVATSYIPTLGSTVTRARDNIQVALSSIPFSTSAGSLGYVDKVYAAPGATIIALGTNTTGTPYIYHGNPSANIYGGGTLTNSPGGWTLNAYHKFKYAFALNDAILNLDGTNGTLNTGSEAIANNTTAYLSGDVDSTDLVKIISRVVYVPRRVTDGDLPTWSFT